MALARMHKNTREKRRRRRRQQKWQATHPWAEVPRRLAWRDRATGLPCVIRKAWTGALCGYVGVPPGNPFHGRSYEHVSVRVHGGLTYTEECNEDLGICHRPRKRESDDFWWLGFDCAHGGMDIVPALRDDFDKLSTLLRMQLGRQLFRGKYRTAQYVREEIRSLARQLAG